MEKIARRLQRIRTQMLEMNLAALIVPRADEYLGEYIPEHNERLRWISGFTGSAGVAIVLRESAAFFVDGRYTVQVRQQVSADLFDMLHLIEQPHIEWLAAKLSKGDRVGYDPRMHSLDWQKKTLKTLQGAGQELIETPDNLVDRCWQDRPQPEVRSALLLADRYTGRASLDKRSAVGAMIAKQGADAALIFAADSVAWLLNIRGQDIPALPLVLGYALLDANGELVFFTDPRKIPAGFGAHVGEGVTVQDESEAAGVFTHQALALAAV